MLNETLLMTACVARPSGLSLPNACRRRAPAREHRLCRTHDDAGAGEAPARGDGPDQPAPVARRRIRAADLRSPTHHELELGDFMNLLAGLGKVVSK